MAEIKTKKGETILVDDEDFEWLNQWRWWTVRKYARRTYKDPDTKQVVLVQMHRLILGVTDPQIQVDHINGNPYDNRRANLRTCRIAENVRNRKMHEGKLYGHKGVYKTERGRFYSTITHNGKKHYLGKFETAEDAAEFYQLASDMLHGAFSRRQ